MHGLIHLELERFARSRVGDEAWEAALSEAGLSDRAYALDGQYSDEDALALVVGLSKSTNRGPQALLEEFGAALAPTLVSAYSHLIADEWRTLDLIENTEGLIHTALRATDPNARPPLLRTLRRDDAELVVIYASRRQMCGIAKGIATGIATHYGEQLYIDEESCMLGGASSCTIALRVEADSRQ